MARLQLPALLTVAVLFGGGGVGYGLFNLAVQLLAIALLACNRRAVWDFVTRGPRALVLLVSASLALPLIQCIPLPPAVWHGLPGRELVRESLALIGKEHSWFPISVDRGRTLLAAISLLPCIAVLALARQADREEQVRLLRLVIGLGLVNLAFGAIQLASTNTWGNFYPGGEPTILYGTFANRNSAAIFLDIALVALLWLPAASRDAGTRSLRILLAAMLALGVLLTQSRSGSALLALVMLARLASLVAAHQRPRPAIGRGRWGLKVLATGLAVLGVAGAIAGSAKLDQTFERFENLNDIRPDIWSDALVSVNRYWPVGSGISTFDEVFQVDESLEYINNARAGRAHNEYLEILLESGVFGALLAFAWFSWIAYRGWIVSRSSDLLISRGAFLALVLIMLQSITDYPLRSQALLCVAALMVNILGWRAKEELLGEAKH